MMLFPQISSEKLSAFYFSLGTVDVLIAFLSNGPCSGLVEKYQWKKIIQAG
jgi:hypothetical protein